MSASPTFRQLPKDALVRLVQDGHGRAYGSGAYLVRHGDRSHLLHVVLDGNVTIEHDPDIAGSTPVLTELGPGALAGDLKAFSGQPRLADIVAGDDVETLEVDTARLRSVFSQHPDLFMTVIRILGQFSSGIEDLVDNTSAAAMSELPVKAESGTEGLDPTKVIEIRARWRQLKEDMLPNKRA